MSYNVTLIIPTGVGAAIGGYAGDALPIARAMALVCDRLITHPNVLNGAQLYYPIPNALYVEGYALDRFAQGDWGLAPGHQNAIGLILDQGIEEDLRWRHLQVADGARATLGLTLTDYVVTDEPLGVELRLSASGTSWGTIANPESLLRAADKLLTQTKAQAIAVIARFPDDVGSQVLADYRHGRGVDPLAGAEAVISHLVVRQFQVPCAHAPALSPLPLDPEISPRSAAEELGYTFLPCVLMGLSRAPHYQRFPGTDGQTLWSRDVNAVVVPASACGGSALMSFSQTSTRIIAVENNSTQLEVYAEDLGISVVRVNSYLEAIGVLCADRAGINLDCFQPDFPLLHRLP
ncbi:MULTISPECIES: DUF3326 domain-containing protein [Synechocystis]|uniref:DUF3326 domain-containing protein n=1 Tax=Synechocystis salina LEGE 00031 TaxID=1828736 RepID=A0ABR9VMQ2_9SYNC|nr:MULTISPECIES: DUF3326 domain-containing protein [Synechocystis]MBD2653948.1 DUF3326 domain-containing protein [Synechocystis sp. FACHB-383]MBE9194175.1 DUF3326 domain-containing protein [Synechocystis sp. LEGE 06083]MBE9240870.1 DUF3326 domain-containing protein [Synechocystis salina LEGE 00041]MBE9252620.1 DUF3326 domain-containing protein [Synechocystis salina LEGE 00031]